MHYLCLMHESLPVEENPWKIIHTEEKLDTPWIRVLLHDVLTPSGEKGIYGITRFKHYAIGVLPVDDEGYTWIVGQYRFPTGTYSWEIPEGGGALEVPPIESAKRELKEETGIEADNWELLLEMDLSNSATDEKAFLYLARRLRFGESQPDSNEKLTVRRIHMDELYARVRSSEITDSLTVAAVQQYRIRQLEGSLL